MAYFIDSQCALIFEIFFNLLLSHSVLILRSLRNTAVLVSMTTFNDLLYVSISNYDLFL